MTFETLIKSAPTVVLDKLEGLKSLRERPDYHPEESAYIHVQIVTNRLIQTGNPDLIMSGIFHDIFKAETAKINPKNGYPTSPKHDTYAGRFIRADADVQAFILSIGANPERVAQICEQHMRIKVYSEMNAKKQQAFRDMEIFSDVLIFSMADDMLTEFVYPYSVKFPTEAHRNIWITLNAEEYAIKNSVSYIEAVEIVKK